MKKRKTAKPKPKKQTISISDETVGYLKELTGPNGLLLGGVDPAAAVEYLIRRQVKFDLKMQVSLSGKRALERFGRKWFSGSDNISNTAFFILSCALTKPRIVDGWFKSLTSYEETEGISQPQYLSDSIAAQPEYEPEIPKAEDDDEEE